MPLFPLGGRCYSCAEENETGKPKFLSEGLAAGWEEGEKTGKLIQEGRTWVLRASKDTVGGGELGLPGGGGDGHGEGYEEGCSEERMTQVKCPEWEALCPARGNKGCGGLLEPDIAGRWG